MSVKHITQKDFIESLKDRLRYLDSQLELESEQIADYRQWYDDHGYPLTDELVEIDREIIERAGEIGKHIYDEGHYDNEMKDYWAWNPDKIASGGFPIDRIPEHVRELARGLYYD